MNYLLYNRVLNDSILIAFFAILPIFLVSWERVYSVFAKKLLSVLAIVSIIAFVVVMDDKGWCFWGVLWMAMYFRQIIITNIAKQESFGW